MSLEGSLNCAVGERKRLEHFRKILLRWIFLN